MVTYVSVCNSRSASATVVEIEEGELQKMAFNN